MYKELTRPDFGSSSSLGILFWNKGGLWQHWDDFEPSTVKNGIFAYMMVGFRDRLRLKTAFSFVLGVL